MNIATLKKPVRINPPGKNLKNLVLSRLSRGCFGGYDKYWSIIRRPNITDPTLRLGPNFYSFLCYATKNLTKILERFSCLSCMTVMRGKKRWRLKCSRSERANRLRENENRENEICSRMKRTPAVAKICSGKFGRLLLITILPENNFFTSTKFWLFISKFSRPQLFFKNASS